MQDEARKDRNLAIRIVEGQEHDPALLDPAALHALGQRLKNQQQLSHARRLYAWAREREIPGSLRRTMRQQHALCTYKDPDCARERALDDALEILDSDPDDRLLTSTDPETLGITGAIHKRKWEIDGQTLHLERALSYYQRAFAQDVSVADGYPAINAAFLLDLLAWLEREEAAHLGVPAVRAAEREDHARALRRALLDVLAPRYADPARPLGHGDWWALATLAEACVGLEEWDVARRWLGRAVLTGPHPWELESTARQLAALLRIRMGGDADRFAASPAEAVLHDLLPSTQHSTAAVRGAFAGKVGLALSGGGFRASLFHIGVLARLAELDVLRHVEVLSCVSGGSIVGAYYYLELKRRLEAAKDGELSREDYVEAVKAVQCGFLAGVRKDIRNRVFLDPRSLAKLLLRWQNRTRRIGDLFEEYLYAPLTGGGTESSCLLRNLRITPGGSQEFHPRRDNWFRASKVPMLILNATTLNTGHNWQFTATFMGEPPYQIEEEIDANRRLRRMYLEDEAPSPHRDVHLGLAVAASACVPGLFRPIALPNLYGTTVRLVDGGVHDNQGVYGLLEQDCNVLLISDASGQMEELGAPPWLPIGVLERANGILMAALRSGSYRHLDALRRGGRIREQMYVHLRKGLEGGEADWTPRPGEPSRPLDEGDTGYGIPRSIQRSLSELRTDLDRFSDDEAHALMLSGYRMTEKELPLRIRSLPVHEQRAPWDFLAIEAKLQDSVQRDGLLAHLRVGRHRFLRWARSRLGGGGPQSR